MNIADDHSSTSRKRSNRMMMKKKRKRCRQELEKNEEHKEEQDDWDDAFFIANSDYSRYFSGKRFRNQIWGNSYTWPNYYCLLIPVSKFCGKTVFSSSSLVSSLGILLQSTGNAIHHDRCHGLSVGHKKNTETVPANNICREMCYHIYINNCCKLWITYGMV